MFTHEPLLALPAGGKESKACPVLFPLGPLVGTKAAVVATSSVGAAELGSTAGNDERLMSMEKRRCWQKAGGRLGQDASGPQRHPKWFLC